MLLTSESKICIRQSWRPNFRASGGRSFLSSLFFSLIVRSSQS